MYSYVIWNFEIVYGPYNYVYVPDEGLSCTNKVLKCVYKVCTQVELSFISKLERYESLTDTKTSH